ncbi:hypothetical protein [Sporosarcina sp. FA15]|uniref:hypothetical protein n=1 Tax=Sporosarcina sp. FA15 TaxID=3413031 RepID=UPI003F654EFD
MISNEETADKEKYSLGYIKLGEPYVINHFIFSFGKEDINISLDPKLIKKDLTQEQLLNKFIEKAKKSNEYILITSETLPDNLALFGESDNKWFLAVRDEKAVTIAEEYIERVQISKDFDVKNSKKNSNQVTVHQSYRMNLDTDGRVIAKMALNYLAYEKGIEFALEANFDPIRNWIWTGTNEGESFVDMIPKDKEQEKQLIPFLPDRAHYIVIMQTECNLIAIVSFYGEAYTFNINLGKIEPGRNVGMNLSILICDWKNQKVYTLSEFAVMLTDNTDI